jgi:hypothetical protein
MREGVVVMMDALGFKGIWKPETGETEDEQSRLVLERMRQLRERTKYFKASQGPFAIKCECISDSIVLGVWPDTDQIPAETALSTAIVTTSMLCQWSAGQQRPLAYRGAVACGRFEMEDGFILGPAVDDAAENMGAAEGAFIWLTPSALKFARAINLAVEVVAPTFAVPLKGGVAFETNVVKPWFENDLGMQARTSQTILDTFDKPELSVQIKRQNTAKFYNLALARSHAFLSDPRTPAMLKTAPVPEGAPLVR